MWLGYAAIKRPPERVADFTETFRDSICLLVWGTLLILPSNGGGAYMYGRCDAEPGLEKVIEALSRAMDD